MNFITGHSFRDFCHLGFELGNLAELKKRHSNELPRIFVKTDYIDDFCCLNIDFPYFLFTHNSDYGVHERHTPLLERKNLLCWYAQNIHFLHPKLRSIPIGLANIEWPHGNQDILREVIALDLPKRQLLYANFDIGTNYTERTKCASCIGIPLTNAKPFRNYLIDLASSCFIVSPNGNGVDCHKIWESLYLGAIPIVTRSINAQYHSQHFPMVIIDDWSVFDASIFTHDLYQELIPLLNYENLNFNNYVNNIIYSGQSHEALDT